MTHIEIRPYDATMTEEWDRFVLNSRNATFLHLRGYMDYHADRFPDRSLVALRKGRIIAALPASGTGDTVCSHPGLTYGGLLLGEEATAARVMKILEGMCARYASGGFRTLVYRPVPHIYHRIPAEEDLYTLFRLGAVLDGRSPSTAIATFRRLPFGRERRNGIRKAMVSATEICQSDDFATFWKILEENLMTGHNAVPVHSLAEIQLLASRFPGNIRLYTATQHSETVAGCVLYDTGEVIHTQYISASPRGKASGALDLLFSTLLDNIPPGCRYFDFGTSALERYRLNKTLIHQKEGFGARTVCHDTYRLDLTALKAI